MEQDGKQDCYYTFFILFLQKKVKLSKNIDVARCDLIVQNPRIYQNAIKKNGMANVFLNLNESINLITNASIKPCVKAK